MRSSRASASLLVVVCVLARPLPAHAETPAQQACEAYAASTEASALPQSFPDTACSWTGRVIRDSGIGITVPAQGAAVRLDTLGLAGSRTMRVVHGVDGSISIYRDADAKRSAGSSGSSPAPLPACSDGAFNNEGFRVAGGYRFSYNPAGAPSNVAGSTAAALSGAFANAGSAATDCQGATRHAGPSARYLGTTSRLANITTGYTCGPADSYNTISWLSGGSHTLAVTCMWYADGILTSSDAVMNRALSFFTGNVPAGCSSATDLLGVMTHEAGHTYGLGHADAGNSTAGLHANQTMNSLLAPCTTKYRTLGTGDLNGMTYVY